MEKFSFKRFWNVFHYEYSRMRTVYVVILAVVVAAIIICDSVLMFPKVFGQSFRFVVKVLLDGMTVFMYAGLFCTLSMFIFAGQNKLMIADLMQPASNAEKFSAKFTVYWLIPALFALALIWLTPYVMEHYEMQDANGEWIRVAKVNGVFEVDESALSSRWLMRRYHFCLYLCLSGVMVLASSIFFRYSDHRKLSALSAVLTILAIIFFKIPSVHVHLSGDFSDYITAESYRVTIFQLTLGLSIVAICTAIAYRRFCRLTLK